MYVLYEIKSKEEFSPQKQKKKMLNDFFFLSFSFLEKWMKEMNE